jgi:uncharacterized membrane protein YgcG
MKRTIIATVLAIVGTTSIASARRVLPPARQYAAPSVTTISTYQLGRTMYRAISGIESRQPFLVVEELGWQRRGWRGRGPDPRVAEPEVPERANADMRDSYDDQGGRSGALVVRTQRPIISLVVGRQQVGIERFRYLNIEGWNNGRLVFTATAARRSYRCALSVSDASDPACEGTWAEDGGGYDGGGINPGGGSGSGGGYDGSGINPGGGPIPGPGPNPGGYDGSGINPAPGGGNAGTIERLKVATKACAESFYDTAQRDNCIQIIINAQVELVPTVGACGQVFNSSNDRLGCITQAASYRGDSSATIKQCAKSFYGSQDIMNCFRVVTTQNLTVTVVSACEGAMYGSQDRLRCMAAVAGARTDPAALIGYCKENNSGTEKILSCIARYR